MSIIVFILLLIGNILIMMTIIPTNSKELFKSYGFHDNDNSLIIWLTYAFSMGLYHCHLFQAYFIQIECIHLNNIFYFINI